MNKAPTTLIIMDGFGLTDPGPGNAVSLAQTPQLDRLFAEYAHTTLSASGLDVGLPAGQMGNSEVGHTNIGGGRVVFQDLPRISRAIDDGSFFENAAYNKAMDDCLEKGSSLHLYGLLSDGGVHSHIQHLYALLQMARNKGLTRVYVHAFLDGRDVSPTSGKGFVADCQEKCRALGVGKIATVMGRYYAMDRDNRWERVQLAYDAMVYGEGIQNPDPVDAVAQSYENDVTDEFMEPVVCDPDGTISDNDSIIFFNFRPDRAREITRAIVDPEFDGFQREFFPTTYVCNTEYDASMPNVLVAWPRIPVKNGLGEYLSAMGMTQLRIAETEKYAHVTFFFNGGVEKQYPGEDRVLVPSPKVATYDLQPEMSAYEVCDKCIERINSGAYLSEIIRSGIQSIDGGQTEASRSLGMSKLQTMRFIILPQAIRNILPAIANEFVTIIKESAICFTIGVQDIMSAVNSVKGATYRITEALVIATALYFCLTYPTSKVIAHFEKKMSAGSSRNAANVAHKRKVQAQEGTK